MVEWFTTNMYAEVIFIFFTNNRKVFARYMCKLLYILLDFQVIERLHIATGDVVLLCPCQWDNPSHPLSPL